MRLICANVNGVRAALRRGGLDWLAAQSPDVITLQEVRADDDTLRKTLADAGLADWSVAHAPSVAAGRAGVAVLSRTEAMAVRVGWGDEFDLAGRWIEADLRLPDGRPVTVVSAYVHTGEADTPRQDEKYRFLDGMGRRLSALLDGGEALVTGDFNVAHREADIKNWRGNLKRAGFLPDERAYLDRWLESGWVDLGRAHGGPGPGPYTWWSWRGKAFDNDAGWRIDYVLATPSVAGDVASVAVGRAAEYAQRWSDHAPVVVDFDPEAPLTHRSRSAPPVVD
jgi:exodeoxyribonuclease-3